jgi:hypothetical protein
MTTVNRPPHQICLRAPSSFRERLPEWDFKRPLIIVIYEVQASRMKWHSCKHRLNLHFKTCNQTRNVCYTEGKCYFKKESRWPMYNPWRYCYGQRLRKIREFSSGLETLSYLVDTRPDGTLWCDCWQWNHDIMKLTFAFPAVYQYILWIRELWVVKW